ncbi:hypothetical protein AgCh_011332 [Apium graveolens]
MGEMVQNKQILLKEYISTGYPKESDMVTQVSKMSLNVPHGSHGIVVKNLYLSIDPFIRYRMSKSDRGYIDSYTPGQPIEVYEVAKVLNSGTLKFTKDDLVWGFTGMEEYSLITDANSLFKIEHTDVPISYNTGLLGMPGMTAYAGFYEVAAPKKGEFVFVSY